jgi:hypothetical protein
LNKRGQEKIMRGAKFLEMAFWIGILMLTGCNESPAPTKNRETGQATAIAEAKTSGMTPLFSRIWRVTRAPTPPPSGTIYIFLPSGTLLETSCVETYRIATWTLEKDGLRVAEDRRLAFTAKIEELTNTSLRLQRRLARGNATEELSLTAVEGEFVCPDMPR